MTTSTADLRFEPEHDVHPSPADWRDQVLYQVLIDRFDDNKDHPALTPAVKPDPARPATCCTFQGGILKGITRRLDYIQQLGATTVWISPPLKNRQDDPHACHGYGIQDFLAVDPRFGTVADLKELVRSAHARGMYVVLDIVINHTGDVWGYENDDQKQFDPAGKPHPFGFWRRHGGGRAVPADLAREPLRPDDAVWPVELQDPDCFKRRGRIRDFSSADLKEAVEGDFVALKDLELRNPKVLDTMIKCHKHWIKELDLDGFRIDTVKHCDPAPTAVFCNAIREYCFRIGKNNFLLFGEVVDNDALLQRYIARNTRLDDTDEAWPLLNAVLDFPLYFVLEEVIKSQKPVSLLRDRYEAFRSHYRDYALASRNYVTFIDNHDQMSRPYRRFAHGNNGDWRLSLLAVGYLLCNLGIPCLYYGTEQAFDGAGSDDSAVREAMFGGTFGPYNTTAHHAFNPNHPLYAAIAKLIAVRRLEPALRYGRQYFRDVSGDGVHFGPNQSPGGVIAFSRVLDTDEVLVALNLDDKPRTDRITTDPHLTPAGSRTRNLLDPAAPMVPVQSTAEGITFIGLSLPPRSLAIYKKHRDSAE